MTVKIRQNSTELETDLNDLRDRIFSPCHFLQASRQRFTIDIIHDQIPAPVVFKMIVNLRKIRMSKIGKQYGFVLEGDNGVLRLLGIQPTHAHFFDCLDGSVKEHILYFVNRSKTTLSKLLENTIASFQLLRGNEQAGRRIGVRELRLSTGITELCVKANRSATIIAKLSRIHGTALASLRRMFLKSVFTTAWYINAYHTNLCSERQHSASPLKKMFGFCLTNNVRRVRVVDPGPGFTTIVRCNQHIRRLVDAPLPQPAKLRIDKLRHRCGTKSIHLDIFVRGNRQKCSALPGRAAVMRHVHAQTEWRPARGREQAIAFGEKLRRIRRRFGSIQSRPTMQRQFLLLPTHSAVVRDQEQGTFPIRGCCDQVSACDPAGRGVEKPYTNRDIGASQLDIGGPESRNWHMVCDFLPGYPTIGRVIESQSITSKRFIVLIHNQPANLRR